MDETTSPLEGQQNMTSMVIFQIERRQELKDGAEPATAVPTGGKGSRSNTAHLNRETPPAASPIKRSYHRRVDRAVIAARQKARRQAAAKRRPMSEWKRTKITRDARRKAVLVELAALGLTKERIGRLVGLTGARILGLMKVYGISANPVHWDTPKQKIIRQGYADGLPIEEIARRANTTPGSVKTTAHNLGITIKDPWLKRRGFSIPEDRRTEYREFIRLGLYSAEAGMCMGLIPRPSIQGNQQ